MREHAGESGPVGLRTARPEKRERHSWPLSSSARRCDEARLALPDCASAAGTARPQKLGSSESNLEVHTLVGHIRQPFSWTHRIRPAEM
jgi:hypothetical protein